MTQSTAYSGAYSTNPSSDVFFGRSVFLSGPMSGHDGNNLLKFIEVHRMLIDLGVHRVFDPALEWAKEVTSGEPEHVASHYMRKCIHELTMPKAFGEPNDPEWPKKYDMIVHLDGWEDSLGACMEHQVAVVCDIEVMHEDEVRRAHEEQQAHRRSESLEGAREHNV